MTIAVALLLGSGVAALTAPLLLRRLAGAGVDPVVVTVGWVLAIVGVIATAAAGLVLMVVPHHTEGHHLGHLVDGSWWWAMRDAQEWILYELASWMAGAILLGLSARLIVVAVQAARRRRQTLDQQFELLNLVGNRVPCTEAGPAMLWLETDRPLAFSLGGHPGTVVLSDGLRRMLSPAGLDAVLAHECAHLRGRHHLLIASAQTLRRAFGLAPLFRLAPAALREQVELAADLSALRSCGAAAVRSALLAMTGAESPELALAMARDAVDVRLRHLAAAAEPPGPVSRFTTCGVLGAALAATPLLIASGVLASISLVASVAGALG